MQRSFSTNSTSSAKSTKRWKRCGGLEAQASASAKSWLAKTQWIWRKNQENWTESEALRTVELEKQHLLTATAYRCDWCCKESMIAAGKQRRAPSSSSGANGCAGNAPTRARKS